MRGAGPGGPAARGALALLLLLHLLTASCGRAAAVEPCAAPCLCRRGLLDCSRQRLPPGAGPRRIVPLPAGTTAM